MGKVIINEHDTAQTASKNSSSKSPHQQMNQKNQSSTSQFGDIADNIGVKMSNKTKGATSQKIAVHDNKGDEKASTADTAKAKAKPVAHVNGKAVFGLPAGSAAAAKTGNKKIITQAKIVERTQVKVANHQPKTGAKAAEALDPELALLANRTSAAEKPRVDMFRSGGKSISGMVGDPVRHTVRPSNSSAQATKSQPTPASSSEENLRFTKFKSILIGVGVALVVAVVGFACINLFGGGKNMCTVLFESNGGSKVAGTEIVCGRTVKRPEDPTKEGFSFEGWIYEGSPFEFDKTPLYKNATLVAKWRVDDDVEIVTVTFDTNGGSAMSEIELAKGKKLNRNSLSTPKRAGYILEDWYLGDKPYDFDQPVEGNITLRAEWTKQQNNDNTPANNDNSTPAPDKVASMTVNNLNLLLSESDTTGTVDINILPSTANYSLAIISNSDSNVADCSINRTTVTCTAKAAGVTNIRVRDDKSGVTVEFKVTVPVNETPPIEEGPDDPKPPVNPGGNDEPTTPGQENPGSEGNGTEDGGNTTDPTPQNTNGE